MLSCVSSTPHDQTARHVDVTEEEEGDDDLLHTEGCLT
jgi:hypothetical protein